MATCTTEFSLKSEAKLSICHDLDRISFLNIVIFTVGRKLGGLDRKKVKVTFTGILRLNIFVELPF